MPNDLPVGIAIRVLAYLPDEILDIAGNVTIFLGGACERCLNGGNEGPNFMPIVVGDETAREEDKCC